MNTTTLYLPVDTTSIAHYFGTGLILPSYFIQNKPRDIQNYAEKLLTLSKKKWVEGANCSIQILLTEEEINDCIRIDDNFLYLQKPISISRIEKILFRSSAQLETTHWNVNNGTAYIPQHLLAVDDEINDVTQLPIRQNYTNEEPKDIADNIRRFDIILGGFAFMKVATREEETFPENYLHTLGFFNTFINSELSKIKYFDNAGTRYTGLFSNRDPEWSKWTKFIFSDFSKEDLISLAKEENVNLKFNLGLFSLNSNIVAKESVLFDIILLSQYGVNKAKSLDDLLSLLTKTDLSYLKVEEICLLFGLKTGYSKLRNRYNFRGKVKKTKFELTTKLDYYTIESIYQFVFNNNRNNSQFNFLERIVQHTPKLFYQGDSNILNTPINFYKKPKISQLDIYDVLSDKISDHLNNSIGPFLSLNRSSFRDSLLPLLQSEISKIIESELRIERANSQSKTQEITRLKMELQKLLDNPIKEEKTLFKPKNSSKKPEIITPSLFADDYEKSLEKMEIKELKALAKKMNMKNASKLSNTEANRYKIINYLISNKK